MGTRLTLERYAELRAEMESAYPRDDVLARAGLTTDEWTGAQREWLDKMGTELARSQFELTNRYSQAFLDRQRALATTAAKVAPPPAAPSVATAFSAPSLVEDVPSPWMADEPSQPESLLALTIPGRAADEAASPGLSSLHAGLPFQSAPSLAGAAASSPVLPAPSAPSQRSSGLDPSTTMDIGAVLAAGVVLPFAQSAASSASPADASSPAAGPRATLQRPTPSPLPKAAPSPPMPVAQPLKQPPSEPPDDRELEEFGAMTMFAPTAPSAAKAALPFVPPPATPSSAAAPRRASISSAFVAPKHAAAIPNFTLEQHASLCAELGFAPARTHEILARYYITAPMKAELDQQWQARFKVDPAVERKWQEAYRIYFGFLTSAQRSDR